MSDEQSKTDKPQVEEYKSFHAVFVPFLNHCKNIVTNYISLFNKPKTDPVLTGLSKYMSTYGNTEPSKRHLYHITLLIKIFNQHKGDILSGPSDDDWLKNQDVVIAFGSNMGREFSSKVRLSEIYHMSHKVVEATLENLKGLPDEEYTKHQELIYPKILIYRIYELFINLPDLKKSQTQALQTSLAELEEDLGVENKKYNSGGSGSSGGFGGMAPFFNMATGIAEQMGIKPPGDGNIPQDEIMNKMGDMINSPMIKNLMQDATKNMAGAKKADGTPDFGQVIGGLADTFLKHVPVENGAALRQTLGDITGTVNDVAGRVQQSMDDNGISDQGSSQEVATIEAAPPTENNTADEGDDGFA